jgi:uncharacterized membrane protein
MSSARRIALISVLSSAVVAISYSKVLSIPYLPGAFEFMTVIIFVSGFCFGSAIGASIGALAEAIFTLAPYPLAWPGAWLFTTSPILLATMALLGALYGVMGGILGKRWNSNLRVARSFVLKLGISGFVLTFIYDVLSSVGFYLAYPYYPSVWVAVYTTFIPLFYPYPPIIHTVTNTIIFMVIAPPLILSINRLLNVAK